VIKQVFAGLSLSKKEFLNKLPLLKQIRANLQTLRNQIFDRIKQKLEFVEITAEVVNFLNFKVINYKLNLIL
jgi:hypothetical protein